MRVAGALAVTLTIVFRGRELLGFAVALAVEVLPQTLVSLPLGA